MLLYFFTLQLLGYRIFRWLFNFTISWLFNFTKFWRYKVTYYRGLRIEHVLVAGVRGTETPYYYGLQGYSLPSPTEGTEKVKSTFRLKANDR